MLKKLLLFTILFNALNAMAQTDSVLLWPNGVPGLIPNNGVQEERYYKSDNLLRTRNITNPVMYSFIPENTSSKTPAVVICPGGGYGIVSTESEGLRVGEWFKKRGIAAFVLNYRLPNDKAFKDKKIVPLQDVQKAFSLIHQNKKKYNVDTKHIGVMGFSAGGHLAATASTLYKYPLVDEKAKNLRPAFSILIYPVISFTDELTHKGTRKNLIGPEWTDELVEYYSNEKQVDKKTPPALLIHAKDDKTVNWQNSEAYKNALEKNGVQAKVVYMKEGGHGFGINYNRNCMQWLDYMETWLKETKLMNP